MSTVAELITEVTDDTGRPDKSTLIARYVRAAIIKCHEIDFFPRDIVHATAAIDVPGTTCEIELPNFWRKFISIVPSTSAGVGLGYKFNLDKTDYSDALEAEDLDYLNYYKVVGDTVYIQSDTEVEYVRWLYYAYPDLTETTAETWITERYPQAVIDLATGYIEKKIGSVDKARQNIDIYRTEWMPQIRQHLLEEL